MQNSIFGKATLLAAAVAAVLVLSSCGNKASSGGAASTVPPSSATSSATPSATQNFPSALLQTPPQSTVTKRSLELIEPMYAATMNVDTGLDQAAVFDFYAASLTAAGFTPANDRPLADATGRSFSRGAEKVDVIFGLAASNAFSVVASLSAGSVG